VEPIIRSELERKELG